MHVSDNDPQDTTTGRRIGHEKFGQDLPDVPAVVPPASKPEREGLPSGYRMRADAHYVDQLSSRRAERVEKGESMRPSIQAEPTVDVHESEIRDRRAEKFLGPLQEELASLTAAVGMLSTEGAPLARRLSIDLVRAQAAKASWMVRAQMLVDGRERGVYRSKPLTSILETVRQSVAAECRLAGIALRVHASEWNATVSVDEPTLVAGVIGAFYATVGVLGNTDGATVRLVIDSTAAEIRSIEVAQDEVAAVPALASRLFDGSWGDRPGGWVGALGAQAARAAAVAHGGTAALVAGDRRGTSLRMTLARGH